MIPCIIPARGGSKGIPHKNIVEVGGLPLIAWSIQQAVDSSAIDRVLVTTDDREIADCASRYGAEVFWRSEHTATDTATSESALLEVIVQKEWQQAAAIVFLQATSPLRQPGDIDSAVELVTSGHADSVFSGRLVEGYCWKRSEAGCYPTYIQRTPRQQRSVRTIEENGSIYVFRPDILLHGGSRLGGKVLPYIMHPLDSYQIDEPADIHLLEQLMEVRYGSHRAAASR